jgi:hypothetical protein
LNAAEGVIVLAATNFIDTIDPAILRSGRFDTKIAVPYPDKTGVRDILAHYVGADIVLDDTTINKLLDLSGADLANIARDAIRDDWCADPATMPDSELRDIAGWTWKCRLENRIYRGRNSAFPIQRQALDALRGQANASDAIALLVLLEDKHGHSPGKRFPLDFDAMRTAGLLNMSKPRLRAARRVLEGAGLLRLVGRHQAGSRPQTFALTKLHPGIGGAVNLQTHSNKQRSVTTTKERGKG